MAARQATTVPKKESNGKKRELNQPPLTIEQRKHRIAELYRLRMKFDEWYIAASGKDVESQVKSKVLNGVILYIKNRIDYLANRMNPPIENPAQHKDADAATSQSPPSKVAGPGDTETKR